MPYRLLITICLLVFINCLILLNFKKIKAFFIKLSSNKKPKKAKVDKNEKVHFKPIESQFRPILKPPEEKKLLTEPKKEAKPEVKPEVKKEAVKIETTNNNIGFFQPQAVRLNQTVPSISNQFTTGKTRTFKTKEELDKEFEDIKNFLDLPTTNTKKSSTNMFNLTPTFTQPKPVTTYGSFMPKREVKQPTQNYSSYINNEVKENIVTIDGDEIDLNKLPLKLRKLLVSGILSRINYD